MVKSRDISIKDAPGEWKDQDGVVVMNETDVPTPEVMAALYAQHPEIAAITRWRQDIRGVNGLTKRDRYTTPIKIFDQFRVALDAAENDDVVSGVVDSTEAMAFSKVSFAVEDEEEEDIWNQIAADIDLDSRLREMWRDLFVVSQFYVAVLYGRKSYKVGGKTETGRKSKRVFKNLLVPIGLTMLDPLKVVPVGNFMFGQEQLAYLADRDEAVQFDEVLAGTNSSDLIVSNLITGKYEPSRSESQLIVAECGRVDTSNMYLLNPRTVFRHTVTRPQYTRFATCRMTSVFELLDMKNQLRESDRASLLGAINFIVLVKIGSDQIPGKPAEISAYASKFASGARVPVVVGDNRLSIEIITPKLDQTLKPERYNTLDSRITSRLFLILNSGNYASGTKGDNSITLSRVIASGLESRRHMIRRCLERHIFNYVYDQNDELSEKATLLFHPKRIALDFDPNYAAYIQALRDRGDVSRQTVLEQVDLDESTEAMRREREDDKWEDIFTPTNVPFHQPTVGVNGPAGPPDKKPSGPSNPKAAGRQGGGFNNGGGKNPNTGRPTGPKVAQKATPVKKTATKKAPPKE